MYGGEERYRQDLGGKLERWDNLENPGIDGRIILKRILEKWDWGANWIDLAQ